jgi:hypothetical protein
VATDIPKLIRKRCPQTRVAPFSLFHNLLEFENYRGGKGHFVAEFVRKNPLALMHKYTMTLICHFHHSIAKKLRIE